MLFQSQQQLFLTRLAIGLGQGLILYLLYRVAEDNSGPATRNMIFIPLLLVSLFAPIVLSLSLGAMPWRKALVWVGIASAVVALLGFCDAWMVMREEGGIAAPSVQLIFFGVGGLFIAHALVTGGVSEGRFMASYATYFDVAWKLGIQLGLSFLFVLAFWFLLWLGAALFDLIKLGFLKGLLGEAWFSIPVLAVAAGGALHLTDIRPTLVQGARTLALTLLSWLLPLITLMVAGFVASLPFTGLQALWSFGHATALLLTATAALLVLINAAHQDGAPERMPPKVLQIAGTVAALLTVPLTLIAAYALSLRVRQYGWTVDRVTVAAILIVALAYAGGYATAALSRGRWLARIERWNFQVCLLILALMITMFTPLASPIRISVADQMARLNSGKVTPQTFDYVYLRDHGGRFGAAALQTLSLSRNPGIKARAENVQREGTRGQAQNNVPPKYWTERLRVFPEGQSLPANFAATKDASFWVEACNRNYYSCDAVLGDFDGDGRRDVVMTATWTDNIEIFRERDGGWHSDGSISHTSSMPCAYSITAALRSGGYKLVPPQNEWRDVEINGQRFRIENKKANHCRPN
jgi:hypothetical protein